MEKISKDVPQNSIDDILRWVDEDIPRAFERVLPPIHYGEDEDAALIYDVVMDSAAHIKLLKAENEKLRMHLSAMIDATEDKGGQFRAWHNHLRDTTKSAKELLTPTT